MEYKIRWLHQAIEDLKRIRELLETLSPNAAFKYTNEVYDSVGSLTKMPKRFPIYNKTIALRRMVVGDYSVFYRINEGTGELKVLTSIHTEHKI